MYEILKAKFRFVTGSHQEHTYSPVQYRLIDLSGMFRQGFTGQPELTG